MRVLHLCKAFSKLSETFIYDYVTEQRRQGVDAHVVAGKRVNNERRPFEQVTIVPWPSIWNPRRLVSRMLEFVGLEDLGPSWRELWPGLEREVATLDPDVIHAHFGRPAVKAIPVAERRGVPLVVTFYGYDISELPRQNGWRRAYQRLWEVAQEIVVLSDEMKERAVQLGAPAEHVHVVHLSRDLDGFPYLPPDGPVTQFVSVGRLTEKKGHIDALKAVRGLVEEGRHVHLQIVGGGPLQETLSQYIQDHDLGAHAELLGACSNEEVAAILDEADAFLLCSKTSSSGDREGTPTVLIEAQAKGLPCVSTKHAGIPEMIPEQNHSLLAEEGNVAEIADRIQRLLDCSDEELTQISEAGRAKIEADFYLSREVEKLRDLYRTVSDGDASTVRVAS